MGRTDRVERIIAAPPEEVFRAFVDPGALVEWLPPTGMTGRFEHADVRAGGSYRMVLTYDDAGPGKSSDDTDVVDVRILEVAPGVRLVQAVDFESDDPAFACTMTMTWSVTPHADASLVEIRADDVPSGISAEDHEDGIRASLDNLARYCSTSSRS